MSNKEISSAFPFESKYIDIKGSKMHYIEEGSGDPILFLHGNPTSSYLWRNIIPYLSSVGRCIAPDLIGMGKSDKPKLDYRYPIHYAYIEAFIEKMRLKNITLVIHDWGSGIGFNYAFRHSDNVKGIAFMEAMYKPMKWSEFDPDFKRGFKMLRTTGIGWFMASVMNGFVKQIMPQTIVRKLTEEEKRAYEAPFPTIGSRKPVRQWPCEIPIDGKPADVQKVVSDYHEWLKKAEIPKILFYGNPGAIIKKPDAQWIVENFPNTESVNIGKGIHYIQEDNPHMIGEELQKWYKALV